MNAYPERMNRTILESARSMMFLAGAPHNLWEQAVEHAVYLRNRTPHRELGMRCPIELFSLPENHGTVSRGEIYKGLKIWGCECFMLFPKKDHKKLNKRSVRGVFLGFTNNGLVKLLRLDNRKIVISRNVTFNEACFPLRDPDGSDDEQEPDSAVSLPQSAPNAEFDSVPSSDEWDLPDDSANDSDSDSSVVPALRRRSTRGYHPSAEALQNIPDRDQAPAGAHLTAADCSSPESAHALAAFRSTKVFPRKKKSSPDAPTFKQAKASAQAPKWAEACQEEWSDIMAREVVEVVPESAAEGFTVLTNRWVLRIKRNADHTVDRYRARVTARGFEQIPGKDFDQTYASVAKLKTFRILLALSTALSLRVTQLDVKTAFLYAPLEETLFMKWPEGIAGEPGTLLKLKKNLYGLKQAPKAWWNEIVGVFLDLDFVPCVTDPCLLVHKTARFFVLLYVDDILLATADEQLRKTVEDALSAKFQLTGFHLVVQTLSEPAG